jgi:uncharacterized membrane protein YphA (DoxX/SURF4 family)
MNIGLWVVQALLALLFFFAGAMKVFAFSRFEKMAAQRSPDKGLGYGRPLGTFIGVSEFAGGVGLVLPHVSGMALWLTPLAATGLAVIMMLATVYHQRRGEPVIGTVVLLALALMVAVGRSIGA